MAIQGQLTDSPSVYVASLADYNDGRLHGRWIDATLGVDHIEDEVKQMLESSPLANSIYGPAEEWAIHDHSGFQGVRISEWESFERVAAIAEGIEEHRDAFSAYLSAFGEDNAEDLLEDFEDRYRGEWDSESGFAEEWHDMVGDLAEVPERLRHFIDWERVAGEMAISGNFYFARESGSVYVFFAH